MALVIAEQENCPDLINVEAARADDGAEAAAEADVTPKNKSSSGFNIAVRNTFLHCMEQSPADWRCMSAPRNLKPNIGGSGVAPGLAPGLGSRCSRPWRGRLWRKLRDS